MSSLRFLEELTLLFSNLCINLYRERCEVRMAVSKSALVIVFLVLGGLAVLFGTVLVFVGPIIIDDQIVKVSYTPDRCTRRSNQTYLLFKITLSYKNPCFDG